MAFVHESVLTREVLDLLAPISDGCYVDATVGGGGHAEAILQASAPGGKLLGIDRDPEAAAAAKSRLAPFADRVVLTCDRYRWLPQILDRTGFGQPCGGARCVDGVLVDSGVSSQQLERPERGFSFQAEGPLDMRMSQRGKSAADLLDELDEERLALVLRRWGEVPRPRRQARAIVAARRQGRLRTTRDLAELVARISPRAPRRRSRIHPATLVFQALRIAVNEELDDLVALCEAVPDLLCDGGVVAIIAFHRLEDRIVKRAFERHAKGPEVPPGVPLTEDERPKGTLEVLTRRPIRPTQAELDRNPRARSARLRAARRRTRGDEESGIARRGVS